MKKILFCLMSLTFLLASCNQDENPGNVKSDEKLYPVKFNAKLNFNVSDSYFAKIASDTLYPPIDTIRDSVFDKTLYYRYVVYTYSGNPVKQLTGVGTEITDSLPEGPYRIFIAASEYADFLYGSYRFYPENFNTDLISYPYTYFSSAFEYFSGDSIFNEETRTVMLERMWGELYVDIQDAATCYIPENVTSIKVKTVGSAPEYYIRNGNGIFNNMTNYTARSVYTFRNYGPIYSLISYPTQDNKVKVYLEFTYNDNTSKTIELGAVSMKKGTRTTLRGNLGNALYNQNHGTEIQLILDEEWTTETIDF